MNEINNEHYYIWLAGLMDGDGCFSLPMCLRVNKKGKQWINVACQVRIGLKKNDEWLVREIKEVTKLGNVYISNSESEDGVASWQTTNWPDAISIVTQVLPYLRLKKHKAEMFLDIAKKWYADTRLGTNIGERVAGRHSRGKSVLLELAKVSTSINNDRQTKRYRDYKNYEYWEKTINSLYAAQ